MIHTCNIISTALQDIKTGTCNISYDTKKQIKLNEFVSAVLKRKAQPRLPASLYSMESTDKFNQ